MQNKIQTILQIDDSDLKSKIAEVNKLYKDSFTSWQNATADLSTATAKLVAEREALANATRELSTAQKQLRTAEGDEVATLKTRIALLKDEVANHKGSISALNSEKSAISSKISHLSQEMQSIKNISGAYGDLNEKRKDSIKAMGTEFNSIIRHIRQIETLVFSFYAVKGAYDATIGMGIELNKQIQTSTVGIATLIASKMDDVTATGKQLDASQKLSISMQMSKGVVEDLRKASLETTANVNVLMEAYRNVIGHALQSGDAMGKNFDEINKNTVQFVKNMSILGQSVGMEDFRIYEEVRSLMSGTASQDSMLAIMLFGGAAAANQKIKEAKKTTDGLAKLFQDTFSTIDASSKLDTFEKELNRIKKGYQDIVKLGTDALMPQVEETAGTFAKFLASNQTQIADSIKNAVKEFGELSDIVISVAKDLEPLAKAALAVAEGFGWVVKSVIEVADELGILQSLIATAITYATLNKIASMVKLFGELRTTLAEVAVAQTAWNFASNLNPWIKGAAILAGVGTAIYAIYENLHKANTELEKFDPAKALSPTGTPTVLNFTSKKQADESIAYYKREIKDLNVEADKYAKAGDLREVDIRNRIGRYEALLKASQLGVAKFKPAADSTTQAEKDSLALLEKKIALIKNLSGGNLEGLVLENKINEVEKAYYKTDSKDAKDRIANKQAEFDIAKKNLELKIAEADAIKKIKDQLVKQEEQNALIARGFTEDEANMMALGEQLNNQNEGTKDWYETLLKINELYKKIATPHDFSTGFSSALGIDITNTKNIQEQLGSAVGSGVMAGWNAGLSEIAKGKNADMGVVASATLGAVANALVSSGIPQLMAIGALFLLGDALFKGLTANSQAANDGIIALNKSLTDNVAILNNAKGVLSGDPVVSAYYNLVSAQNKVAGESVQTLAEWITANQTFSTSVAGTQDSWNTLGQNLIEVYNAQVAYNAAIQDNIAAQREWKTTLSTTSSTIASAVKSSISSFTSLATSLLTLATSGQDAINTINSSALSDSQTLAYNISKYNSLKAQFATLFDASGVLKYGKENELSTVYGQINSIATALGSSLATSGNTGALSGLATDLQGMQDQILSNGNTLQDTLNTQFGSLIDTLQNGNIYEALQSISASVSPKVTASALSSGTLTTQQTQTAYQTLSTISGIDTKAKADDLLKLIQNILYNPTSAVSELTIPQLTQAKEALSAMGLYSSEISSVFRSRASVAGASTAETDVLASSINMNRSGLAYGWFQDLRTTLEYVNSAVKERGVNASLSADHRTLTLPEGEYFKYFDGGRWQYKNSITSADAETQWYDDPLHIVKRTTTAGSMEGFAVGGYTGNGGMYDVAGLVHRGEYVLTAENTKKLGLDRDYAGNAFSDALSAIAMIGPKLDTIAGKLQMMIGFNEDIRPVIMGQSSTTIKVSQV